MKKDETIKDMLSFMHSSPNISAPQRESISKCKLRIYK